MKEICFFVLMVDAIILPSAAVLAFRAAITLGRGGSAGESRSTGDYGSGNGIVEQGMEEKTYEIPVVWQEYGIVRVKAASLAEAVGKVQGGWGRGDWMPQYSTPIDDSLEIDREGLEIHNPEITDEEWKVAVAVLDSDDKAE